MKTYTITDMTLERILCEALKRGESLYILERYTKGTPQYKNQRAYEYRALCLARAKDIIAQGETDLRNKGEVN